jgi:6-phosphogluconolactonase
VKVVHAQNFVGEAVALIVDAAKEAIAARGQFRLGLCGGNTPRPIFAELARQDLPWDVVIITFGDERCVPPDDAQSNFRMAKESLFNAVPLPAANIHRLRGELDPDSAAESYAKELAATAPEPRYIHDLLLLGVGDDGHTASLFPGTAALEETEKNVVANFVPKFSTSRLTLTFPIINAARRVAFLVGDAAKKEVVDAILGGESDFPAVRVQAREVIWLLGF